MIWVPGKGIPRPRLKPCMGDPPPTWPPSSPPPATLAARDGSTHGTLGTGVIGGSALCVTSFSCTWIIYDYLKAGSLKQSETRGVISYSDKCRNESPKASSAWWWRRGAETERDWASTGAPTANVAGAICVWQLSCSLNTSGAHPGKSSSNHRKQQRPQGWKQAGPQGHGPPFHTWVPWRGCLRSTCHWGAPSYRCSVVPYTMRCVLFQELAQEPSFCVFNFCLKEEISILHLNHLKSK